eukprot:6215298-Amphidinium_carterae.1
MQAHTSWSYHCVLGQAGFSSLLIPVGTMENNVFQIFNVFTASNTDVSHLERRVRTFLVPHSTKSS